MKSSYGPFHADKTEWVIIIPRNREFILYVAYRPCITWIIHQQLSGYKVEEKLRLGYANKKVWMPLPKTVLPLWSTVAEA
jgi:hypothetical protein